MDPIGPELRRKTKQAISEVIPMLKAEIKRLEQQGRYITPCLNNSPTPPQNSTASYADSQKTPALSSPIDSPSSVNSNQVSALTA